MNRNAFRAQEHAIRSQTMRIQLRGRLQLQHLIETYECTIGLCSIVFVSRMRFDAKIYVMTTGGESNALSCGIGPLELGTGKEHWLDVTHPSSHKQSAMWHSLR